MISQSVYFCNFTELDVCSIEHGHEWLGPEVGSVFCRRKHAPLVVYAPVFSSRMAALRGSLDCCFVGNCLKLVV